MFSYGKWWSISLGHFIKYNPNFSVSRPSNSWLLSCLKIAFQMKKTEEKTGMQKKLPNQQDHYQIIFDVIKKA